MRVSYDNTCCGGAVLCERKHVFESVVMPQLVILYYHTNQLFPFNWITSLSTYDIIMLYVTLFKNDKIASIKTHTLKMSFKIS